MDIAFAPGPTPFDLAINTMFTQRLQTTVIGSPATTIADLIQNLNTRNPQSIVNNILIGTHGDDNAFMKIQLNGAFGGHTTYEDLTNEMASLTRPCQIAAAVIDPRPLDAQNLPIPPFVLIKGCRIGQALPFLNKLRDAINGLTTTTVQVAAPIFFEALHAEPQGTFEFLYYDFHHFSKTKVATKAALVAIMQGKHLPDISGTAIANAKWAAWIPDKIHTNKNNIQNVNLNPQPIPHVPTGTFGRYKYSAAKVFNFTVSINSGTLPTAAADRIALLKTQVAALAANPGTNLIAQSLATSHAYPFFTRFGYTGMDDLIDNLSWTFTRQDAQNLYCDGIRHEYNINPPIVSATNNELIFNYYAANTQTTSVRLYSDLDPRFFVITT